MESWKKREGWFPFAMARLRPWRKAATAVVLAEKPVRMAASSVEGYCAVMASVTRERGAG